MFNVIRKLTSFAAMVAVLFVFTTETMAAKKSKTLKNTQKKGFVRCGVSQGLPGFSNACLLYTSPSPRDATLSRMPSSA